MNLRLYFNLFHDKYICQSSNLFHRQHSIEHSWHERNGHHILRTHTVLKKPHELLILMMTPHKDIWIKEKIIIWVVKVRTKFYFIIQKYYVCLRTFDIFFTKSVTNQIIIIVLSSFLIFFFNLLTWIILAFHHHPMWRLDDQSETYRLH